MRRLAGVFLLGILVFINQEAIAQQQPKGNVIRTGAATKLHNKLFLPQSYLGNSAYKGGPIKRDELTNLMRQGLTSRDSLGNKYKVASFEFSYAERVLYEDSLSNTMVLVDYMTEFCTGDTLSAGIAASIYNRIKPGDTVYFDRISVLKAIANKPGEEIVAGKGMKFVVTK